MDTIFARSSGAPPAAIAVVRISGPQAGTALKALAGRLPPARRAVSAILRDAAGEVLDHALVLWLPGPSTATGDDTAELHLHGGRAVVTAVERALSSLPGLRPAIAGEFTRRAFANGRIDLAEAEGLADLLSAETELQRRSALAAAGGVLSRRVEEWRLRVLALSAEVEAELDFGDEDDVGGLAGDFARRVADLRGDIGSWLELPHAEAVRDGYRVVLAGPPNAGKSSLFNAMLQTDAAITAPTPGTTRDVIERFVAVEGVPLLLVDTAGLREHGEDIEAIGIDRARGEMERADLVLWLGPEGTGPHGAWEVAAKADLGSAKVHARHFVSAHSGQGLGQLLAAIALAARSKLAGPGNLALNRRQRDLLMQAHHALVDGDDNPLIVAENLRIARSAFDRVVGRTSTENVLDTLFGRFCIGK
jgi:tRNA modification GTPase